MANNLIQIKRSLNTATPASLANGEFAFTSNGDVLYIGANGTIVPVAGKRVPGTLTANQALVANATSGIDKIITANLTLGGTSVGTINAVANLTHLGTPSNTELVTSWAIKNFVDLKVASASNPQGSNGQFQYNDSGVLAGTNNMVFNNTTGQITIGNSTVNVQLGFTGSANSLAHFHGNQNAYVQVIMNNVNNGTRSSSDFIAENDLGTETENFVDLGINSSTYNDAAFSAMGAGDSYLYAANNDLAIGTADAGQLKFFTGGTTSAQIRATIDAGGNVGIGNTAPNAKLQVTGTANISGLTTINANLVLGAAVSANGSTGSAGHVLKSGATGNVYWEAAASGVAGSNAQVQFNANGSLAGDSGFTFDGVTDTLSVAGAVNIGANVIANTTMFFVGNSTVNSTLTASLLQVSNSTSTANLTALDLKIGTTTVNSTQITATLFSGALTGSYANISGQVNTATLYAATSANIASVVQANSLGIFTTAIANAQNFTAGAGFGAASVGATVNSGTIGISSNTTVNASVLSSLVQVANSTGNVQHTATSILAQTNTTVNATMTAALLQVSNATATSNLTAIGLSAGANVVANTTALRVGNTTLTTTNAVFGGTIAANGGIGTSGQLLVSAGAANAFWSNSLGVFQFTDLTVSGNLTVLGDLVSLNVATLAIEDPLITLAKDQAATTTYTDAVDIGFIAPYGNTAAANSNWTGLFRDQSDSGIYKLFSGNIPTPTTTVDTANLNFTYATLQAQLKTGGAGSAGFISNATNIAITANSTLNVSIVANTLSLATALPVTSGGTGLSSVAVGDLLVGNSTNTITRLTSGTDGYVLQINGTGVVAWNSLDGGTF